MVNVLSQEATKRMDESGEKTILLMVSSVVKGSKVSERERGGWWAGVRSITATVWRGAEGELCAVCLINYLVEMAQIWDLKGRRNFQNNIATR